MAPGVKRTIVELCAFGLCGFIAACGAKLDAPAPGTGAPGESAAPGSAESPAPVSGGHSPASGVGVANVDGSTGTRGGIRGSDCVALPVMKPLMPTLDYSTSCALEFSRDSTVGSMSGADGDARPLLVGRWELCGAQARAPAGLEFGGNGRVQLLERQGGRLVPVTGGSTGTFTLLPSGQFMIRESLLPIGYATFMQFDETLSAMEFEMDFSIARYARVAPDVQSAAANTFSTSNSSCSMAGVWDTSGEGQPASFAFNDKGEWIGGDWRSDLCASHFMYGTYQLTESEFDIVTNVGAGRCAYWFGAGFAASFSADCKRLTLAERWDNCTGGRGYLTTDDVLTRRTE